MEDLVPEDNFYHQVEQIIDLGFVRDLAGEFYSSIGRPSIDPVVFFKLQLIAFFEGIRSERQLMDTVNLNLAHRWFISYDLDEPVPDHSSLSKFWFTSSKQVRAFVWESQRISPPNFHPSPTFSTGWCN